MIIIIPVNLSFFLCKLGGHISNKNSQNSYRKRTFHEVRFTPGGGAGASKKNWMGVCGPLPETLTLFHTKICDFHYPISDLIKNLIPYFRPDTKINTLFQTCIIISSPGQTNVKCNADTLLLIRIQNGTISSELKLIPQYKATCIMRRHKYRIRACLTLI